MLRRLLLSLVLAGFGAISANAMETAARNVILVDYDTGEYLYVKDHDIPVPPASMSKLMTTYMIFDRLKNGSLTMEDEFSVSENAWRKGGASSGGSTMFLALGSKAKVGDLLKGIIIQSGNDACIVVAENLSGSEENFAIEMNEKAKKIGLHNSHFANSTGLPHPDHRMSVEDLAKLSRLIIEKFPEYYHLYSERSFSYNKITQGNRNPLLYSMNGADGLKTGHTEEAGYSLTSSVKRGDRRLILVMTGMKSNKERGEESEKMMAWGFREFDNYKLFEAETKIATIPVWQGVEKSVDLTVDADVIKTIQRSKANKVKMAAFYDKPVKAPIAKGDKLGVIKIKVPDEDDMEVPLVAAKNVARLGLFGRMRANLRYLLFGAE